MQTSHRRACAKAGRPRQAGTVARAGHVPAPAKFVAGPLHFDVANLNDSNASTADSSQGVDFDVTQEMLLYSRKAAGTAKELAQLLRGPSDTDMSSQAEQGFRWDELV